jgi:hypothetical protein
MKWSGGSYDGGGRAHAVAFDPNNAGNVAFCGDVWGIFRSYTSGDIWVPVMSGCKLKNNVTTSGDIYGRGCAFSKMRNGRAYYGVGTLTGGPAGWFGHVEQNSQQVVKDSSITYGFASTFASSPASISPRPTGRLIETDYDSFNGVEYVYLACTAGLVRAVDDGSNPLAFTVLYGTAPPGGAWKFVCMNFDGTFYAGSWGDRAATTPVSGQVFHVNNPRSGTPTVVAESGAPPYVNDMKLIGGQLYAVANSGWFGTLTEGGPWVQMASSFFAGCDLSSVCGVGNVLYVSTSSHPAGSNKWFAKSVDGGVNWQWLTNINYTVQGTSRPWWLNPAGDGQNKGPNDQFATIHMDCDPHDPNTWISASFRGGWSTRDGGATIQPSMNGLGGSEVSHLLVNGPGDVTNDDVDWHGAHTTDHYGSKMTPLAVTPTGFTGSGMGAKTFFGHNYVVQSTTPPADITKDGVSIADEYFRARAIAMSDYQVDSDGYVYMALFGGGVIIGDPNPIDVNIINPADGATLQVASVTVSAQEANAEPIDHATVQVNSSTPLSMVFNNTSQAWERLVALPQGTVSIRVDMFESDGTSSHQTITVSNGVAAQPGPDGNVLFPTEGQVLPAQQVTVSCDWESPNGIDPQSVQISVDNGATWVQMDAPGVNTPGGQT